MQAVYPLTSTCRLQHVCPHTCTQSNSRQINKCNKSLKSWRLTLFISSYSSLLCLKPENLSKTLSNGQSTQHSYQLRTVHICCAQHWDSWKPLRIKLPKSQNLDTLAFNLAFLNKVFLSIWPWIVIKHLLFLFFFFLIITINEASVSINQSEGKNKLKMVLITGILTDLVFVVSDSLIKFSFLGNHGTPTTGLYFHLNTASPFSTFYFM